MSFDTHVMILNWNGGKDTAACVRSVLGAPAAISVFDNASSDDSLQAVRDTAGAEGITAVELTLEEIGTLRGSQAKLHIIRAPENIGFAKGINALLRELIHHTTVQYAWLLNNDAFAAPGALSALKDTIQAGADLAFAGSVILDAHYRDLVQCCGVDYYKLFGVGKLLLKNRQWSGVSPAELDKLRPVFQHGASLLVKMSCLPHIGLMDEQFFLYAEEHDWQVRAASLGYGNRLSADSIVYHKGSLSTVHKKHLFYYYYNMSSVYFSRKHYSLPVNLAATLMLSGITMVRARMDPRSMAWGLRGIFEGWKKKLP